MKEHVPTFDQLILPTIEALKALGGSGSIYEILDKIVEMNSYSESVQQALLADGRPKLSYNAAWARTYLKLYGAIENSGRGVWALTDKGEKIQSEDVEKIKSYSRKVAANKQSKSTPSTPKENVSGDDGDWKHNLLQEIRVMTPDAFERLSRRMLREAGFTKVEVTGRPNDGGIDGIGVLKVNLISFQVLFQCKRYSSSNSVGSKDIRDFRGAMAGRTDKGLFITTGTFTAEARKEANREGTTPIELIDGEALCDLLKDLKLGVHVEVVEQVSITRDFFQTI
jgi:restriction system protein